MGNVDNWYVGSREITGLRFRIDVDRDDEIGDPSKEYDCYDEADVEAWRAAREALLADPEYKRIRQLYQNLADALDALDEAGERPTDGDGYALYVTGKSFNLSSNGEIEENEERWKRHLRKK